MFSNLIDELLRKSKDASSEAVASAYKDAAESLKVEVLRSAVTANYVALERWVLSTISTLESSKDRTEELLGRRLRSSFERGFGEQSPSPADVLLQESEALQARVREIEASAWEGFDPESPTYPQELDIAMQAWRSVSNQKTATQRKKPRQQINDWVIEHYGQVLLKEAVKRISIVANWDKSTSR